MITNRENVLHIEYNSGKANLILPEYGRVIQQMIQYAQSLPTKEERTAYSHTIVELMYQMSPLNKTVENFREKLWNHAFEIAEYNLDVDLPQGINIKKADEKPKPDKIHYPKPETKLRHYGNNVMRLINKALEMDDEAKREGMTHCIGSYMKLAFRTWNREHFVTDEVIKSDIKTLSNNRLSLDEDAVIENIRPAMIQQQRRSNTMNNRGRRPDGKQRNFNNRDGQRDGNREGSRDNNRNKNSNNRGNWGRNRPQ